MGNYPVPKKGERITCLSCKGTGIIYKGKQQFSVFKGCKGKGYIIAT